MNQNLSSLTLCSAFNAGLAIFGALLVASKEPQRNSEQWRFVEKSRPYLDLAAEVLHRLDSGNRVIERCVEYLSQLSMILNTTGKLCLSAFQDSGVRDCLRLTQHYSFG